MRPTTFTVISIFFVFGSMTCSSNSAEPNTESGDASTSTGGKGNSNPDLSAATGMFMNTQVADSDDCGTDPSLRSTSSGEYYRFTPTIQNGEQVIVEDSCGAFASCPNPSPVTWRLDDAGIWARSGTATWSTSPPCTYMTAQFTLDVSNDGLLSRQFSYEAPLDLVNGQCPHTVVQNATCSHIYLLYLTRVN